MSTPDQVRAGTSGCRDWHCAAPAQAGRAGASKGAPRPRRTPCLQDWMACIRSRSAGTDHQAKARKSPAAAAILTAARPLRPHTGRTSGGRQQGDYLLSFRDRNLGKAVALFHLQRTIDQPADRVCGLSRAFRKRRGQLRLSCSGRDLQLLTAVVSDILESFVVSIGAPRVCLA